MANILILLKEDHRAVAKILKILDSTTSRATKSRQKNFSQLKNALTVHADFEETVLYPQLRQHSAAQEEVLEAYEEHHLFKILLAEISETAESDDTWKAKITVLSEIIQHHVKEEESQLFPYAKKILPPDKLMQMGADYLQVKQSAGVA